MVRSQVISRHILAFAAWTILALVAVGFIALIPTIDTYFTMAAPGSLGDVISKAGGALVGLALLAAWGAALWHASVYSGFRSEGQKATILALLILGNALAAVVYYFAYVHWLPKTPIAKVAA